MITQRINQQDLLKKIYEFASWLGHGRHRDTYNTKVRIFKEFILSPFKTSDEDEVNGDNDKSNNEKSKVTHSSLPFVNRYPYEDNECEYPSGNVKGKKVHGFLESVLDNLTATLRNKIVTIMPVAKVNQGILLTTPGTNIPTTNEANIIFALSKKKSEITFKSLLSNIQCKSTIKSIVCQGMVKNTRQGRV